MIPILPDDHTHVYDALAVLAPHAKWYLGVGVQEGGCVRAVVSANPHILLTLCDTWGLHHGGTGRGNHDHIDAMLKELGCLRGNVYYLDGPSQELIPTLTKQYDLSYVDGDHSEQAAFEDLINVWARTAGIMVVHDIYMPPVRAAMQRFLDTLDSPPSHISTLSESTGTAVLYR